MRLGSYQDRVYADQMYERLRQAAKGYVIRQLGQMRQRDAVAMEVAERFGVDYGMAQRLVKEVAEKETGAIHKRRMPLILLVSFVTFFAGAALLYSSGGSVLRFLNGDTFIIGWATLAQLGTGLAMIAGSIIGVVTMFNESIPD